MVDVPAHLGMLVIIVRSSVSSLLATECAQSRTLALGCSQSEAAPKAQGTFSSRRVIFSSYSVGVFLRPKGEVNDESESNNERDHASEVRACSARPG